MRHRERRERGEEILRVEGLVKRFGGLVAVDALDLRVERGEIRGLIGPNGAGKTTTFNVVSGFFAPTSGRIVYRGRDVTGLAMHRVAAQGLVRTFQHSTLFLEMRVRDNVLVGRHLRHRRDLLFALRQGGGWSVAEDRERVEEILAFFGLSRYRDALAAELPYGAQRALGMAVALAAEPDMMLLDEPFAGMNPEETRQMMELVAALRGRGITILLVEHDMQAVMGLCDTISVMNFGRFLAEGTPAEIRRDPRVIAAYLGSAHHAA